MSSKLVAMEAETSPRTANRVTGALVNVISKEDGVENRYARLFAAIDSYSHTGMVGI